MCLALFAFHTHPRFPVLIAANRDEFYERPTAAAGFWKEIPALLAGRDLREGGTWMGVTRSRRFAAVTNYREPSPLPPAPRPTGGIAAPPGCAGVEQCSTNSPLAPEGEGEARSSSPPPGERSGERDPRELRETRKSRGLLVKEYLEGGDTPLGYLGRVSRTGEAFNGFNLVAGDLREMAYYSNREGGARALGPGVYGLSNHLLDTPWPKVERSKAALFDMLSHDKPGLIAGLFRVLADGYRPEDAQLPDTGVGLEWERLLSSAFIKSSDYGTRSSTVFLVDGEGRAHFIERSFGPGGAPLGAVEFEFRVET